MPTDPTSPLPLPPLRPGAVIHGPGSEEIDALIDRFAAELRRRGFRVGGVVQRNYGPVDDCADRMELVDVATGQSFGISQNLGRESQSCRVDPMGVADASQSVRRAVQERVDLLVVNKFAGLESHGEGLAQEMLDGMAEGVPVLTSIGSRYLNEWQQFTGGFCDLLSPTEQALWDWWGPHRLYEDLRLGVEDAPVRRVVVGTHWVAVETERALGLAARYGSDLADPARWMGKGLKALVDQAAASWDPLEMSVGLAAINAHYNADDVMGETGNGLDLFTGVEGRTVVVGGFPQLARRLPNAQIIDMTPRPGEFPEPAGDWLLRGAEAVAVTASALGNRTLPRLLRAARGARVAMVGPGTPLTPRLFSYGIEALAGFIPQDREAVVRVVGDGGGSRDFHPFGRMVTLRRPAQT